MRFGQHEEGPKVERDGDGDDLVRATVLATVARDTPKEFWETLLARTRQTYRDTFFQTQADPGILAEQRLDALYQARHFRMETVLYGISLDHGLKASMTLVKRNGRSIAFVAQGAIAMTQAYVPAMGEMPKPAKFRERYATMNKPARGGILDLGDQPCELLESKEFYGIVTHNPVGKRFEEELQALGMAQLSVPNPSCTGWLAQLPIQEILANYPRIEDRGTRGELGWRAVPDVSTRDE